MSNSRTPIRMKGAVTYAYAENSQVVVWVASPTGDCTDNFQYKIPCLNQEQAEVIAEIWRTMWELPNP